MKIFAIFVLIAALFASVHLIPIDVGAESEDTTENVEFDTDINAEDYHLGFGANMPLDCHIHNCWFFDNTDLFKNINLVE